MSAAAALLPRELHVVTGASSGIGRAIAEAIAGAGGAVAAVGRRMPELAALAARFPDCVRPTALDITDERAVARFGAEIEAAVCSLRALVHCAGVQHSGPLAAARAEEVDAMYRTIVCAPLLLTQRLLPALERGKGWLIFVNSSAGMAPRPGVGAYSAMQHASRALAESWRQELNARDIRVLSVFAGRTNTRRIEQVFAAEGRPYVPSLLLQPEDIAGLVRMALALPPTVELTDISLRPAKKTY